ncbi:tyrosine protein phosphatase yvh1 [Elasticomyces elasticus]|nr:tyrosine protein phosphatase yvh1 [Elasticomyces elasticus]KAK3666834.1 tyrosine protein phosphatase yvh1 [Elasticomyces elasticus]KAK4918858.1 tyrosine protein phosphatase yvh1 [Elasticomyces elasticus]KAK5758775.1 tyrosine protein phosphatase yvh1 [Elasticomyces elasticus]
MIDQCNEEHCSWSAYHYFKSTLLNMLVRRAGVDQVQSSSLRRQVDITPHLVKWDVVGTPLMARRSHEMRDLHTQPHGSGGTSDMACEANLDRSLITTRWPHLHNHRRKRIAATMDPIPQCGKLYVGSLEALDQPDLLEEAGITYILSVLEFDYCDYEEFAQFQRLLICAEDDPREDLFRHFDTTNAFTCDALEKLGGTVLIHCAMGQSRSVTIACAYLISRNGLSAEHAQEIVRLARAEADPNEGFMAQLRDYRKALEQQKRSKQPMMPAERESSLEIKNPESDHECRTHGKSPGTTRSTEHLR